MKGFMVALLLIPCASQAAVYKCSTEGDTYFSQIPCEENAEVVEIEETTMFSDPALGAVSATETNEVSASPPRTQEQNLRDFVETLQRQRLEQVEKIDDNIIAIEALMSLGGEAEAGEADQAELTEQLNHLNEERDSIIDQYAAMISEAERRVTELVAK